MKISVERTGGFAGLTENLGVVDTGGLARAQGKAIEEKVHAAKFFQLPDQLTGGPIGGDLYRLRITVADGGKQHSVSFTEEDPEAAALQELVAAVTGQ